MRAASFQFEAVFFLPFAAKNRLSHSLTLSLKALQCQKRKEGQHILRMTEKRKFTQTQKTLKLPFYLSLHSKRLDFRNVAGISNLSEFPEYRKSMHFILLIFPI
jgi:hypothetical protein